MATDIAAVLANLLRFYDFTGKTVIAVGAGGGQMAGYGAVARRVAAVDCDGAALDALAARVRALGLSDRFDLVEADFLVFGGRADAVLFEFALHEIPDPAAALAHAAERAPDVVVIDHAPGSPWSHVADESEKVAGSWAAVAARGVRRRESHDAVQRFASHDELLRKIEGQGAEAVRRAERWRGSTAIEIAMPYAVALL